MSTKMKASVGALLLILAIGSGYLFASSFFGSSQMATITYQIQGDTLTFYANDQLVKTPWVLANMTVDKVIWVPLNEETNASVTHNLGVTVEIQADGSAVLLAEGMELDPGTYKAIKMVVRNVTIYDEDGNVIDTWNTATVHIIFTDPVTIEAGVSYTVTFFTDFDQQGHAIMAEATVSP